MRVPLIVLALVAMPLVAGVAQGSGKSKPRSRAASADESTCNADQAAAVARARAEGRPVPPGLDKKNCEPAPPPAPVPPPPSSPPVGPNVAKGVVFEDLDGNGVQDPFAGEMGLAGWTIELRWNGQLVSSATSDVDGLFEFPNLGNTGNSAFSMCAQMQSGYVGTRPADGSGCFAVPFTSSIMTWFEGNFGMKLP